jgi:eukaryotic-like serine/threonine-protein kinase
MNGVPREILRSLTPLSAGMPHRVGPYTLLGRLGLGGMAEVFLARQSLAGDRLCVLKRVRPEFTTDPATLKMFFEEARLGMALDHPNIARVFDCHHSSEASYLVMEWVPGVTLRQLIGSLSRLETFLEFDLVAQLIADCAAALNAAHTARSPEGTPLQIVHRDVSPQNILVSTSGVTKLIDFGIARASTRALSTQRGVIKGKPLYMSPEQARDDALDIRSDLYSLGLVMYELLTNARALVGRTELEMLRSPSWDIVPIEAHRAHQVPVELRFVCWKLLSANPDDRFPTPRALVKVLRGQLPVEQEADRRQRFSRLVGSMNPEAQVVQEPTRTLSR